MVNVWTNMKTARSGRREENVKPILGWRVTVNNLATNVVCSYGKFLVPPSSPGLKIFSYLWYVLSIFLLIAAVLMTIVSSDQWNFGEHGLTHWRSNCRYVGDYITLKPSSPEQCGGVCIAQFGCTHFTNGPSPEGDRHCYMYNAPNGKEIGHPVAPGWVCGYIPSRFSLRNAVLKKGNMTTLLKITRGFRDV